MKKYILIFLAALMLVPSCNLDENFYTYLDADSYITDANTARKVLYGLYRDLCANELYGQRLSIVYDMPTDISKVDGTSLTNNRDFCCNAHMSTSAWVQDTWKHLYSTIFDANDFIERATAACPDMTERDREITLVYIAEARVIRALMYFELVRNWKNITLITTTEQAKAHASTFKQDKPEDVYGFIEKELRESADVLPWSTSDTVRPTTDHMVSKASALGLLARLYVTWAGQPMNDVSKWEKAKQACEEIILSGQHDLLEDYEELWDNACNSKWNPKESLMEVSFYSPSISSSSASNSSGMIGKWNGVYVVTNTSPLVRVDARCRAVATFAAYWPDAENDRRFYLSVADFYYEGTDVLGVNEEKTRYYVESGVPGIKKVYETRGGSTPITIMQARDPLAVTRTKDPYRNGLYVAKWDLTKYVDPSKHLADGNYSNANWYILRYSDVLLMYAEAINEISGPTPEAYDAINKVRRRGYGLYTAPVEDEPEETPEGGEGTDGADDAVTEDNGGSEGTEGGNGSEDVENPEEEEPVIDETIADLPAGLSQEEFRQAVRNERAYELCFEGQRKHDLIRWGIYAETVIQTGEELVRWNQECPYDHYLGSKYTVKGKHELQPIPQRELDLMPLYIQNPNWGN